MKRIHFLPDETVFFIFKFWASLKLEETPSLGPVDTSRNPSLTLSFAMDKNSSNELYRILNNKKEIRATNHLLTLFNNCHSDFEVPSFPKNTPKPFEI
jgi:hypothetical protein